MKNEERRAVALKLNVFIVCSIDEDTGQLIPVRGLCRRAEESSFRPQLSGVRKLWLVLSEHVGLG